jgi:hypothetical protein
MKRKFDLFGVSVKEKDFKTHTDFVYGAGTYDTAKQNKKHKETCAKNRKKRKEKKR